MCTLKSLATSWGQITQFIRLCALSTEARTCNRTKTAHSRETIPARICITNHSGKLAYCLSPGTERTCNDPQRLSAERETHFQSHQRAPSINYAPRLIRWVLYKHLYAIPNGSCCSVFLWVCVCPLGCLSTEVSFLSISVCVRPETQRDVLHRAYTPLVERLVQWLFGFNRSNTIITGNTVIEH